MAAHHGDGAGKQSIRCIQPHQLAHTDADDILHDRDHTGNGPVNEQQQAAFFQQADAGAQTNRGKEGQHKGRLIQTVKRKCKAAGHMTDKGDEHKQESAYHRRGNAILFQKFHFALDKETNEQQHGSHGDRHNAVGLYGEQRVDNFKCHAGSLLFLFLFFSISEWLIFRVPWWQSPSDHRSGGLPCSRWCRPRRHTGAQPRSLPCRQHGNGWRSLPAFRWLRRR